MHIVEITAHSAAYVPRIVLSEVLEYAAPSNLQFSNRRITIALTNWECSPLSWCTPYLNPAFEDVRFRAFSGGGDLLASLFQKLTGANQAGTTCAQAAFASPGFPNLDKSISCQSFLAKAKPTSQ